MAAATSKRLDDVLSSIRERVIDGFVRESRQRGFASRSTPFETVVDHIPDFLDELIDKLAHGESGDVSGTSAEVRSARDHAGVRWEAHYDLSTMVREYGLLRDTILEKAEAAGANITLRDFNILSNWITVGVAEAVNEYNRRRDEQLRVEKDTAETERRRLDAILNILPVGLVIADVSGNILRVNEADNRIWGAPPESAPDLGAAAWSPSEGTRIELEQRAFRRSLRRGEVVSNQEIEIVGEGATIKTILVSSAPIRDAEGEIVGAVSVNVDITETKQMLRTAQSAVSARDEIVAVVSHDLRDPLGVIEGSALLVRRMLTGDIPGFDVEKAQRKLDTIRRAAKRMGRLIADLLDVTRLEEGQLPLELSDCDVTALLRTACEEALPLAHLGSLEMKTEMNNGGTIRGDRNRLLQVFANLIGNALKFTPAGGSITIGAEDLKKEQRFYVRDTGPGIHEKQLPHIFDRFWQAHEHDRRGTGLGLAIAKGVIEAHGGRIWAESRLGQGTAIYFTLPAVTGEVPKQRA